MEKKNEIRVPISYYISYDNFEGDINDIIKFLQNLPQEINKLYNPNKDSVYLNGIHRYTIEIERGYEDSHDEFSVVGWRWETDEEFNKRLETSKKISKSLKEKAKLDKEERIRKEKELFLELSKKYGRK